MLNVLYLIFNLGYTASIPSTTARAIRAHLLDLAGDHNAARGAYREAARRTLSLPEQQYLRSRAL